nr:putative ribonuclease H-like domain-containing protein [Tanacetum cinerariifolium]
MRPFGCHVTILNTLDHLGKFDGKSDEGFFVGYSTNSNAFRVYNTRTRKVEKNLHINFLEDKPIITSNGQKWLFDINALTELMNYVPVIAGTNIDDCAGKGASFDACQSSMETRPSQDYILIPLWNDDLLFDSSSKDSDGDNKDNDGPCKDSKIDNQERPNAENSTKDANTCGPSINIASSNINTASPIVNTDRQSDDFFGTDNDMRSLDGVEVDISNISTTYPVPTTPNTKIHKDHSFDNVIGDIQSGGFTQEEGIDYDEVFAHVAKIEPIRLFLAYASFMGFLVYQMDVKSAFLYGRIKEEVYVCQPLGFKDPNYPDKVYKVEKALYGLHQAPKAWYETMAKYLLDNGFHRGKIDQTIFIKRQKEDIMLVQVYIDDIIFGSTKKVLYTEFEKLIHDKFQMSSMGELTFFLGLQVKQKSDEIFISQDKYIDENLRKFKYTDVKPASTLMDREKALLKDSDGDDVDVNLYRRSTTNMVKFDIGQEDDKLVISKPLSVIFIISIDHVNLSHYPTRPKPRTLIKLYTSHQSLMANLEFCDKHNMVAFLKKPQGSEEFHQTVDFLNSSHIMYALTKNPTIYVSLINQFWCTASSRTLDNGEIELNATVDGQDKTITEASVRRHLKLADVDGISTLPPTKIFEKLALMGKTRTRTRRIGHRIPQSNVLLSVTDEAITKEMHDGFGRATTTASRLESKQGGGNISKTQTNATPSRLSSLRTSSEGGLGCHVTTGASPVQARPERLSNLPNEPPLGEALENELKSTKVVYNKALITLTKRVKKLEKNLKHKKRRAVVDSSKDEEASLDKEDSPKQGRMIEEIDADENTNLVKSSKKGEAHETDGRRKESDDTEVLDFSTASPQKDDDEETLAKTLVSIKKSAVKDKGKAIMEEFEPSKKIKKKELIQISLDEEIC